MIEPISYFISMVNTIPNVSLPPHLTTFMLSGALFLGCALFILWPQITTPRPAPAPHVVVPQQAHEASASQSTLTSTANAVPPVSPKLTVQNNVGFYSDTRVKFNFAAKAAPGDQNGDWSVKLDGNRIYLYPANKDYHTYPFVEVIPKNASDTIQQAIQQTVLNGYNPADCPIVAAHILATAPLPTSWSSASLTYAPSNFAPNGGPDPLDPSKCPAQYTSEAGSIQYFAVDPAHPTVLLYFSVSNGLLYADSTNSKFWFQTLAFTN